MKHPRKDIVKHMVLVIDFIKIRYMIAELCTLIVQTVPKNIMINGELKIKVKLKDDN